MTDPNYHHPLIERILSDDKQAYNELYERTIPDIYKTTRFLIEDKADVDDLVQEIYIQLFKSLKKYDTNRPFKSWYMGIVMKQIQSYRRKRWMHVRIIKKAEALKQPAVLDFSNEVVNKLTNQELVELVTQLPYKLQQVIILRYLNDFSQDEVARILEIPLGTVKSRINAALNKLRANEKGKKLLENARNVYEY
ncbi:sigma-70 family RNA polymerase sigma factor [Bacillus sp. JJ1773]|uniref:sigma-70 family RNA polymerase sigma factor n=1 Tax=Bacillus sp. JJ1773 TaxID=3122965 RepID=UPI002FFE901F